jgi:hypothetical protein
VGWEARKIPVAGVVFFLDFPLYRTSRDLARPDRMLFYSAGFTELMDLMLQANRNDA